MTAPRRILIVEDEMMVAMLVEDMLLDLGHIPVGPAVRLEDGLALAERETLDLAILDVNLNDQKSFPIADLLVKRGIPVIFATGYGIDGLQPDHTGFPVMTKPFSQATLIATMEAVVWQDNDLMPDTIVP